MLGRSGRKWLPSTRHVSERSNLRVVTWYWVVGRWRYTQMMSSKIDGLRDVATFENLADSQCSHHVPLACCGPVHRFTRRGACPAPWLLLPCCFRVASDLAPRTPTHPRSPCSVHHTHLGLFLILSQQELLVETEEGPFNRPEKSMVHSGGRPDVQRGRSLGGCGVRCVA